MLKLKEKNVSLCRTKSAYILFYCFSFKAVVSPVIIFAINTKIAIFAQFCVHKIRGTYFASFIVSFSINPPSCVASDHNNRKYHQSLNARSENQQERLAANKISLLDWSIYYNRKGVRCIKKYSFNESS